MENQGFEEFGISAPWIPQTPTRPIYTETHQNIAEGTNLMGEERSGFHVGNLSDLDHMPFGDLLALANAASVSLVGRYNGGFESQYQYVNSELSSGFDMAVLGNHRAEEPNSYEQRTPHHREAEYSVPAGGCFDFFPVVPEKLSGNQELNQGANAAPGPSDSQCIAENWEPLPKFLITTGSVSAELSNNNEKGLNEGMEHIKTPQKPKRRKHRPKVVKEAKPKKQPKPKTTKAKTPKPADGQEKQRAKRKYVRKKGVNKDSESQPLEATVGSPEAETSNPVKKSCRRALDFKDKLTSTVNESNLSTDAQREGGCCNGELQLKTYEREGTHSENQESRVPISSFEGQVPNTPLPTKSKPRQRKRNHPKGKQKENSSDIRTVNHDPRFDAPFMTSYTNSVFSLTEQRQGKETASGNLTTNDQIGTHETNLSGLHYNNFHDYQKMSWLYFPYSQQKKITLDNQRFAMPSASCSASGAHNILGHGIYGQKDVSVQNTNCYSFTSQANTYGVQLPFRESGHKVQNNTVPYVILDEEETYGVQPPFRESGRRVQNSAPLVSIDQGKTLAKKRTWGHARYKDLASLNKVIEGNAQSSNMSWLMAAFDSRPQTSTESVPEIQLAVNKKRRTKKPKEGKTNQEIVHQNRHQSSASATGNAPDELWEQKYSIERISEQLRSLQINENAIVPYRGDGTIVPYSPPVKKRHLRPKVDLDDETNRVWELLLENIDSDGIDGKDEETRKWWEEERRVFRGRADSFIARMHLVQGDRRFTPWKGSVVDSVVGVFLTQNVADHLSSSAFMSMAAQFPIQSASNTHNEEGTSLIPREPIIYFDSEDSMSTTPACNQSSITKDNIQHDEEKESVNGCETSICSSEIASSSPEPNGKVTNYPGNISEVNIRDHTFLIQDHMPTQDVLPSDGSTLSSQSSIISVASQQTDQTVLCSASNSEGEDPRQIFNENCHTSFMELLRMAGSSQLHGLGNNDNITSTTSIEEQINIGNNSHDNRRQSAEDPSEPISSLGIPKTSPDNSSLLFISGESEVKSCQSVIGQVRSPDGSNEPSCSYQQHGVATSCYHFEIPEDPGTFHSNDNAQNKQTMELVDLPHTSRAIPDNTESTSSLDNQVGLQRPPHMYSKQQGDLFGRELNLKNNTTPKSNGKKVLNKTKDEFDWDSLRRQAEAGEGKKERTSRTMDSVDWEAVRTADPKKVAKSIETRGMSNVLAGRIQDFLNRVLKDHGSIDLEWLRDVQPDKAKEYLLSFRGLGLKSVECVRLLTLHHLAFPVDTNVGRIAVRLGWVPLQPLPESLQLHLLELYPMLESVQKYLWPRLCKFDQKTLYELHYQLITFGKVFCTKGKPNCNACPMRGECRHFASAYASARLALPGTEEKSIVGAKANTAPGQNQSAVGNERPLFLPQSEPSQREQGSEVIEQAEFTHRVSCCEPIIEEPASPEPIKQAESTHRVSCCEPIIEEPASPEPEPEPVQVPVIDIEDAFSNDSEEIPTIEMNVDAFTRNLKSIMEHDNKSMALVALNHKAASIPTAKLKDASALRTEHQVYELPDSHPLLVGLDKRDPDDPCSYLLAIWRPGETADSIEPPERKCSSQDNGTLCDKENCFPCNSVKEARLNIIRGTILIPCRTAMKGSFPLNGTYFQVNEVFADHKSSQNPIHVPRDWIWNLPRKTVYFGTSATSIFRGLSTQRIQHCFWRGYVCVRGFDRKIKAPRPLVARLHIAASRKAGKGKGKQANAAEE